MHSSDLLPAATPPQPAFSLAFHQLLLAIGTAGTAPATPDCAMKPLMIGSLVQAYAYKSTEAPPADSPKSVILCMYQLMGCSLLSDCNKPFWIASKLGHIITEPFYGQPLI
jgi:hypothetical protein